MPTSKWQIGLTLLLATYGLLSAIHDIAGFTVLEGGVSTADKHADVQRPRRALLFRKRKQRPQPPGNDNSNWLRWKTVNVRENFDETLSSSASRVLEANDSLELVAEPNTLPKATMDLRQTDSDQSLSIKRRNQTIQDLSADTHSSSPVDSPASTQRLGSSQATAPQPRIGTSATPDNRNELPPCRVALENKMDYHYEVIESTILRFPLPWKKLGCNPNIQPIQFDVALAENHKFGDVSEKDGFIE